MFFPGSLPLYVGGVLTFGLGVSGDGVNQDDTVTGAAAVHYHAADARKCRQLFRRLASACRSLNCTPHPGLFR